MKRKVDELLKKWKDRPDRKPLLLRGARQTGKTYSARVLGSSFSSFVELNFEEDHRLCKFFSSSLEPAHLIEQLSPYAGQRIVPGKTLLFMDEIQQCPDALRSLRFFYEKMPDLAVIAAGSLLEFSLAEIPSFGVGRISSIFMYPLSFFEFLDASGNELLKQAIVSAGPEAPLQPPLHQKAMELLKTYLTIGGLPEAVKCYVHTGELIEVQRILDELIVTYRDDFSKYKTRVAPDKLDATFHSIARQAGRKFMYSAAGQGSRSGFSTALDLLLMAGLGIRVYHSDCRGIPISAEIKTRRFKVLPFDTGIYQRLMGLDIPSFLLADDQNLINKGALAEIYVGLSLISSAPVHIRPALHYWCREKRSSSAEVDYVIQLNNDIIPVEVKSSGRGSMQSMHLFLRERSLKTGLRFSAEPFSRYGNISVIPLYAAENFRSR